jgi:hypothetical protein
MTLGRWLANAVVAITAAVAVLAPPTQPAQAQSIFCPSAIPLQSGIVLNAGTCTNGTTGAFSNAALASQALSDLSQGTTLVATSTVESGLATRREVEQARCPEGYERVNGVCQRIASTEPVPPPPPPPPPTPAAPAQPSPAPGAAPPPAPRRTATAPRVAPAPIYKAPPPPVAPAVRFGSWAQGFGDYERQTGTSSTSIACCTGVVAGGLPNPLALSGESKSTLGGFEGGIDATFRNVLGANDGVIAGVLAGYMSQNVQLTTTSISSTPNVGNGSSALSARLQGPSAGAYLNYFNGPFSGDLTFRTDFLSLSETFNDTLAFTVNATLPGPTIIPGTGVTSTFAGSGSTNLNNYTTTANVNYRFPLSATSWIEPTAGIQYVASVYASSAAALGLSDGHLFRVQGGARFGMDSPLGAARLTTTVTGLLYDDVVVSGGFIQNVAFGSNALIINDQGLLRGEGILGFNLAYANGVSLFAQGDVRGGKDLFGAGGKGGIRIQW